MTLKLEFKDVPGIGHVEIVTNSNHGSYDELYVNGETFTEDGEVIEMVRSAIPHDAYLFAMYEAQYGKEAV